MKIIYDTREKLDIIKPILERLKQLGIEVERRKLDTGDYVNADCLDSEQPYIIVDRKRNMQEVANNLGKGFDRYKREILRARENHILLVVLICDPNIRCMEDVKNWKSRYTSNKSKRVMTGETLYKIMNTQIKYYSDCLHYEFVHPDYIADRIAELLTV